MQTLKDTWARGIAVVAIVIAIIALLMATTAGGRHALGNILDTFSGDIFDATTSYKLAGVTFMSSSGFQPSAASTGTKGSNFGNCQIQASSNTIAASSTITVDCVKTAGGTPVLLTGVTAGDNTELMQSTTTPTTFEGLEVRGASASSTSGAITMSLYNGTGATFTWTAAASTSFQYSVKR